MLSRKITVELHIIENETLHNPLYCGKYQTPKPKADTCSFCYLMYQATGVICVLCGEGDGGEGGKPHKAFPTSYRFQNQLPTCFPPSTAFKLQA